MCMAKTVGAASLLNGIVCWCVHRFTQHRSTHPVFEIELDINKDVTTTIKESNNSDLKVLQDSLATLTTEKSRMTNAYQEEKKRWKSTGRKYFKEASW